MDDLEELISGWRMTKKLKSVLQDSNDDVIAVVNHFLNVQRYLHLQRQLHGAQLDNNAKL